jgi:diaminohydroxyphosphoribosylaminopyrimidine deaminase/5-amino-6-(5-phosphoribosylamino)uracil reductase
MQGADEVLQIPPDRYGLDMRALMLELGRRDITTVLIEGGGSTLASAFEAGIVDKVMFFVAPKIVGGREAVPAVSGLGVETMAAAIRLRDMKATPVGPDLLIEAYVVQD